MNWCTYYVIHASILFKANRKNTRIKSPIFRLFTYPICRQRQHGMNLVIAPNTLTLIWLETPKPILLAFFCRISANLCSLIYLDLQSILNYHKNCHSRDEGLVAESPCQVNWNLVSIYVFKLHLLFFIKKEVKYVRNMNL